MPKSAAGMVVKSSAGFISEASQSLDIYDNSALFLLKFYTEFQMM